VDETVERRFSIADPVPRSAPEVEERAKWLASILIWETVVLQLQALPGLLSAPHCCDEATIEAFLI
jgi:hypothetical protein